MHCYTPASYSLEVSLGVIMMGVLKVSVGGSTVTHLASTRALHPLKPSSGMGNRKKSSIVFKMSFFSLLE